MKMRRAVWLMVWLGAAPGVALARTPSPTPPPSSATTAPDSASGGDASTDAERYDEGPGRIDRFRAEYLPEYARTLTKLLGRGIEVRETRGRRDGRLRVQLRPRGSGARVRLLVEF